MNPFLLPFSGVFRLGVGLRRAAYRHGWFKTRRLSRPVVSVGNLSVGGTGKTPLVAGVARILLRHGWKPSILARGYGRSSKADMIVLAPGADRCAAPQDVGDEPALLARMLPEVPLVLCADRFRGGQEAEDRFHVNAHILDDGFQHLALTRDVNIVALDATQPVSGRQLLPAGRLREPPAALRRANIVVVTRTEAADAKALEQLVAKIHPAARVFHSRTELAFWQNALTGAVIPREKVPTGHVAAFCGIGNPQAFFRDLRLWGFSLAATDAFPDHHVYTGREISRLVAKARAQGAEVLLTTQKDAVKFSAGWSSELPILACEIELRILEAEEFEATLLSHLKKAGA